MTFQIIRNAPPLTSQRGRPKYPFGQMEVNDAFDIDAGSQVAVRNSAVGYGQRHSKKFSVCKHGEGYRCQRVA